MNGHLITAGGTIQEPTVESIRQLAGGKEKFWLDLESPNQEDQDAVLRDIFHFHPLALEDAATFGQRPKLDTYDDFAMFVAYGVNVGGRLVEVHLFYSEHYLVTIHRDSCPAMNEMGQRLARHTGRADTVMLLYRVVDALVDSFFPVLSAMDDQIDELEDAILIRPTERQLGTLFDLKRSLIAVRKVVTPQRDMFASLLAATDTLPGMTEDAERYFRDLYDHLIRISDLVDSYRDLLTGALDTHLSTVSNRLNVVMKQLTIVATVFLPITFLTGFFGQNFGWLVGELGSFALFAVFGLGLQIAIVLGLMIYFRRRGWLSSDASTPVKDQPARAAVAKEHRWHLVHPHVMTGLTRANRADSSPGERGNGGTRPNISPDSPSQERRAR